MWIPTLQQFGNLAPGLAKTWEPPPVWSFGCRGCCLNWRREPRTLARKGKQTQHDQPKCNFTRGIWESHKCVASVAAKRIVAPYRIPSFWHNRCVDRRVVANIGTITVVVLWLIADSFLYIMFLFSNWGDFSPFKRGQVWRSVCVV